MTLAPEPAPDLALSSGATGLVLRRVFDAPIGMVFRAWTDPARFAAWFGPHGSRMTVVLLDVRPGGQLHFCHHLDALPEVWVRGVYHEVVSPTFLSFSVGFADDKGRHRARDGFAAESLVEVRFNDLGGKTEMIVRHTGLSRDQGEGQGWRESLERLQQHLHP